MEKQLLYIVDIAAIAGLRTSVAAYEGPFDSYHLNIGANCPTIAVAHSHLITQ